MPSRARLHRLNDSRNHGCGHSRLRLLKVSGLSLLILVIFPYPNIVQFAFMLKVIHQIATIALASLVALVSLCVLAAAQEPSTADTSPLTAAQLDQLVSPIALYPDPVIAQILMAATYPLEIVEADRWLQTPGNAALKGDQLEEALQQQPWDPSVKSLTSFPQLLHMLDTNLQWTEQLGDTFLAQQADIMDAIQRLRQRAQVAGNLASTPQQTVSTEDQEIAIEPVNPDSLYVPAYNPWCVYGVWPYPDYPPLYSGAWDGSCAPADYSLAFGPAIYPALPFWAWGAFDWRHRLIHIRHQQFEHFRGGHEPSGGIWQHDPAHRHGVPYRDPATTARFGGPASAARRELRGYAPQPTGIAPATPSRRAIGGGPSTINRPPGGPSIQQHVPPPAYESLGRGAQVRGEAVRGFSSRMAPTMPSIHPAPMIRTAPAVNAPAGALGGFHGGAVGGGFHGGATGGGFRGGGGGRR